MAQIGCFVPASSCRLKPFDAIFTRMGAADSIALGRSTFLEELGEASDILRRATSRSLVIIDELGRGTSTMDGMAIADATVRFLASHTKCITLFITHYPEVAVLGLKEPRVQSYYMDYVLSSTSENSTPEVTFLYRLAPGIAESSYGLNVARMSGLPISVIHRATSLADGSHDHTSLGFQYSKISEARKHSLEAINAALHEDGRDAVALRLKQIQTLISSMCGKKPTS